MAPLLRGSPFTPSGRYLSAPPTPPLICVATLVPRSNAMGRIPDYDPLSIAFACHHHHHDTRGAGDEGKNYNVHCSDGDGGDGGDRDMYDMLSHYRGYWFDDEDVMYRASMDRSIRIEAQRVVCQIEEYIGRRDCLQVISLREHRRSGGDGGNNNSGDNIKAGASHRLHAATPLSVALQNTSTADNAQHSVMLWRSRYGISRSDNSSTTASSSTTTSAVRTQTLHVHALRPLTVDICDEQGNFDTASTENAAVLTYDKIQCALERHQRDDCWQNRVMVVQDIPGLRGSQWVKQVLPRYTKQLK